MPPKKELPVEEPAIDAAMPDDQPPIEPADPPKPADPPIQPTRPADLITLTNRLLGGTIQADPGQYAGNKARWNAEGWFSDED